MSARTARVLTIGAVAIALGALVAWSAFARYRILAASPFPLGVDGYFYALQGRAVATTGHLAIPASPLAFYLIAPFVAATDPITGAKLGAAILGAAVAVPAYLAGVQLGRGRGAGFVAAAIATTSVGSTYLSIEFVKQSVGLSCALLAIAAIVRAAEAQPATRGRIVAAALATLATLLAHKLAIVLVVAIAGPALAVRVPRRALALGVGAAAVLAIALGVIAGARFPTLHDLGLVTELVSATPRWGAPALATPEVTLTLQHEPLAGLVLAVVAAIGLALAPLPAPSGGRAAPARAAAIAAITVAVVLALPWLAVDDPEGLGFRLRLAAFVPMALAGALATRLVVLRLAPRAAELLGAGLALALVLRTPSRATIEGEVALHPALVSAAIALPLAPGSVAIVPERQTAFLLAYYHPDVAVRLRPIDPAPAGQVRVLSLRWIGGTAAPLIEALDLARETPGVEPPINGHAGHPDGLVVVTEPTWWWLLDHVSPAERERLRAWPTD